MRIRPGVTAWMPAWNRSRSTSASCSGIRPLQARIEELPERTAAADEVLPEPALRLVDPERAGPAGRQPLEMLGLLVAVQAVAVLVHRREERLERVRVVVRRDPDVVAPRAGRKRMLGRVDPPAVGPVAEELGHLVREGRAGGRAGSLRRGTRCPPPAPAARRSAPRAAASAPRRASAPPQSSSAARSRRGGRRTARRPRPRRSRRTGASARRSARERAGRRRSRTPPSPSPRPAAPRRRRGPSPPAATPGRSPPSRSRGARGAISAASSESGSSDSSSGRSSSRSAADRGIREPLVREAEQRRELVGAMGGAGGRHHRLLVPGEEARDLAEVRDLGHPLLELLERVRHRRHPSGLPFAARARSSVDRAADF